ncbi:hypothetical protein [Streptomyces aureoversilis]|uniref:Uncharacterized protein n=1 Tax=Streptomyces aureoversilis TaxID=67277 RepID=A0ABV9ZW54_9ACTN
MTAGRPRPTAWHRVLEATGTPPGRDRAAYLPVRLPLPRYLQSHLIAVCTVTARTDERRGAALALRPVGFGIIGPVRALATAHRSRTLTALSARVPA